MNEMSSVWDRLPLEFVVSNAGSLIGRWSYEVLQLHDDNTTQSES